MGQKGILILVSLLCLFKIHTCIEPIYSHSISKTIWLFSEGKQTLFQQLNILNTKYFASLQNYTINEVNQQTYSLYLSEQKVSLISSALNVVSFNNQKKNLFSKDSSNILQKITQRLIMYGLLAQKGGVFVDSSVTVLQPFDNFFDFTIKQSQLVNGGYKVYQALQKYCIGFYNDSYSSVSQDLNKLVGKENSWEFKPNIVLYPNLDDYFIACSKGNNFIQKLFQTYVQLLTLGKQWPHFSQHSSDQNFIGTTNIHLIYEHAHLISSHWIFQKQQSKTPIISSSFTINTLGLITINSHLGPTKIKTQFALDDYKIYQYLAKLTTDEVELAVGKLSSVYRFNLAVQKIIQQKLMSFENQTEFWVENSFAHKYWIRHIEEVKDQKNFSKLWQFVSTFNLMKNSSHQYKGQISGHTQIQSSSKVRKIIFDETKPKWQSLQKNIWIIWDNGVEGKSNLVVELCYENLKRSAQNSGFNIYAVSRSKVHEHLSAEMMEKIDKAIENASFDLSRQAVSDLWRMALVYQHGGVYFDASTFSTDESLDWIVKLPQIQENLVWNRYGKQPEVFMLWNTYYGCPLEWEYDSQNQTRSQWHLSYENNFIVASKGAELIKEWLDTMLEWIQLPYEETEKLMGEVGMIEHKWTWDSTWNFEAGRYLTAMDSLKYVIGRREKIINQQKLSSGLQKYKNSAHYYKLWSIPGQFLGQQKLRGQTNYEHIDYRFSGYQKSYNTIYKYKFPVQYIEYVLGPISFQGKFFSRELAFINKLVNDFFVENQEGFNIQKLHQLIHPDSLLAKALFNNNPNKTVELIKYYGSQAKIQRNFKGFSKVWVY